MVEVNCKCVPGGRIETMLLVDECAVDAVTRADKHTTGGCADYVHS